eukprot:TRINITY_DN10704_c0_g1_i1.p1 TRINITY_DN10704_c0_g1~~TRINITY_DN10704_c0_g1_i1.p1  ORF type:complete len:126 (-),score=21.32 TRINITY_DN10704_c0_g1_i1:87-464(-)
MPGFVVQWGISGIPSVDAQWQEATIPDDPVIKSNIYGYVSFATSGPNTRTTQIYVNYGDNSNLDSQGFTPFGLVSNSDMTNVVEKIYSGYGQQPNQELIYKEGNAYLQKYYPLLSYNTATAIVKS